MWVPKDGKISIVILLPQFVKAIPISKNKGAIFRIYCLALRQEATQPTTTYFNAAANTTVWMTCGMRTGGGMP
jgi:hypothetical protein